MNDQRFPLSIRVGTVVRRRAIEGLVPLVLAASTILIQDAAAAVYYVAASNPACSDSSDGSLARPYCTIGAALARHHTAGTTIEVQPGTYREQVTVPASGADGLPITLHAAPAGGAPVRIDGADDFSSPALWQRFAGSVYLAPSVTWNCLHVYLDGSALKVGSGHPKNLPSGSFEYVAGEGLYVNAGGSNPGSAEVLVGHRPYGVYVSGRAWVTVDGFTVLHAEDRGIQLTNGASHVEILRDSIAWSGRFGLQAKGCSAVHIASCTIHDNGDHGISLTAGTNGCTIERNECYGNLYPPAREANGIYLFGAPRNLIRENRLHHNQDTGLQIQSGSDSNVCIQNQSWSNGDHGYDHLRARGNVHVGDVAYGNFRDGFSIEGNSTGHVLSDCIAIENGLTTNEFDLWVDDSSSVAFESDDNLFWNSTAQSPVKYRTVIYARVADYVAASGHDTRTLQADPAFVNAAGGDFHLRAGSPAIDNANSTNTAWPAADADGNPRVDDPGVPNSGLGPIAYADRGAYEFQDVTVSGRPGGPGPRGGTGNAAPAGAPADGTVAAGVGTAAGGLGLRLEPNPTRGECRLTFDLTRPGPVTARLFALDGRRVCTLADAVPMSAGRQSLPLTAVTDHGAALPGGVYFVELRTPEGRAVRRLAVIR